MPQKRLELTPEELERVLKRKRQDEKTRVSPEELFIAEFGYYYGWDAMLAILSNDISMQDANVLINGARKVWNRQMIDMASIMFTSGTAARSGKKSTQVMNKGLKEFYKRAKVDL